MAYPASKIIIIYIAFTVLSTLIIYALSVFFGHAPLLLPYVSDIGDKPWESTIFTQCFVLNAALFMFFVQVRFVYAFHYLKKHKASNELLKVNTAGVYVGYSSAFGLFVLACFQESHAFYFHNLGGVLLFFLGGTLYFTIQSVVSINTLTSTRQETLILKMRLIVNSCMLAFLSMYLVGYVIAHWQFRKPWEERCTWRKEDGGWTAHLVSAGAQWMLFFLFLLYFLSFYKEFGHVMLTKTRIIILLEDGEAEPQTIST